MWRQGNTVPIRNLSAGLYQPYGVFVTSDGDIYVDNGAQNHQVVRWRSNSSVSTVVMTVEQQCQGMFVDTNNTLYCSESAANKVVKQSLDTLSNTTVIVAGTGTWGTTVNTLAFPTGIYVTIDFDLYVADSGNQRIQLFRRGNINATTVAGNGAPNTITLSYPTGLMLDADGYLFIIERNGHRIVGSGPSGFRCIVGCTGYVGSASHQLNYPNSFAFDTYGNIYVADRYNNRIQKFLLDTNGCGKLNSEVNETRLSRSLHRIHRVNRIQIVCHPFDHQHELQHAQSTFLTHPSVRCLRTIIGVDRSARLEMFTHVTC
jgi:hypothetical protein